MMYIKCSTRHISKGIFLSIFISLFAFTDVFAQTSKRGFVINGSKAGRISFQSSNSTLNKTFDWAKKQALDLAFSGDPVGPWYEAALPGREAFCIRDVSHQTLGAHALGLDVNTKNMMLKFAQAISASKDWCSFWEINRYGKPAPVDYYSDSAFWYNLPANFDLLDAIYRQYKWTGNKDFLNKNGFTNFYKRTVHDYVKRWDLGLDKIMHRKRIMNTSGGVAKNNRFTSVRGIPSYDEGGSNFVVALDQLATQYAGYRAYSKLMSMQGEEKEAAKFLDKANQVRNFIDTKWWDEDEKAYYSHLDTSHTLVHRGAPPTSAVYYDVAKSPVQINSVIQNIINYSRKASLNGVEGLSHLPGVLYNYGQSKAAYEILNKLPQSDRKEYPEVSYSIIGSIVSGLMGVSVEIHAPSEAKTGSYTDHIITTLPHLTDKTNWAELKNLNIHANQISVRHQNNKQTSLTNENGPTLIWKAYFQGTHQKILVDGNLKEANIEQAFPGGPQLSWVSAIVGAGETIVAKVP